MYNSKRIEQVKKLHLDSFDWKAGRIPLGIWVNDSRKYKEIKDCDNDFHKKLFERQMTILEDTIGLGSDLIPVLGVTNYGIALIPSVLGAGIINSSSDVDKIEDMGYWIEPLFSNIKDIDDYELPGSGSDLLKDIYAHFQYYRKNSPEGIYIVNSTDDPFTIAETLRGSGIYTDLYDYPEHVHKLIDLCTNTFIDTEKKIKKILEYDENIAEFPSYFGIWCRAIRLGADSLVNLSEEMIREFVIPYYKKIAYDFNCKLYLHFCSVSKPIGKQILEAVTDCEDIVAISSQLGVSLFEEYYEKIKDRLAIEAGYGNGITYESEKHGGFKKWARYLRDKYKGKTGLILYTTVPSVDEGRKMWYDWNDVWEIN